jgi:hypothetical protein
MKKKLFYYAIITVGMLFQSCAGKNSNSLKDPNYIELNNIITYKIDSASNHYLKFQDFEITNGDEVLPIAEITGATYMVTFHGSVCTTEDIQWNGLITDPSGGKQLDIKIELGSSPNTGLFHPKNSCDRHRGWANFVKTDTGWRFVNFMFFF